jgi:hypothetical protein
VWSHRSLEVRHGSQDGCWPFFRRAPAVAMDYIDADDVDLPCGLCCAMRRM